MQQNAMRCM